MIIGIDLDNTIINYDNAFVSVCAELTLPLSRTHGKTSIRDEIRSWPGGESIWQTVQKKVYAEKIYLATLYPGVQSFFSLCQTNHVPTYIISHKTKDLQHHALGWLKNHSLLPTECIFFEETRKEKISRINKLKCTIMIDDLHEVFEDPSFPTAVKNILFDPSHTYPQHLHAFTHWTDIATYVFS